MGRGHCRYEVFAQGEPSDDLEETAGEPVTLAIIERSEDPEVFEPPKLQAPASRGETFRLPETAGDELLAAVVSATRCYVIEASIDEAEDLGFLEESMALALSVAEATDGVIVDRTSNIGYTPEQFEPQSEDPEIRDTVSLEETKSGQTVSLRSHGMSKYAESDLSVKAFPAEHVELARRLLLDDLCRYSAFHSSIRVGETLEYRADNPQARLFFEESDNGTLLVSDMHESEKRAAAGLSYYLEITLPAFLEQRKGEVFDEAASKAKRLVEEGQDDNALHELDHCLEIKPDNVWALGAAVDVLARLVGAGASGFSGRRDELARQLLAIEDDSFAARAARAHALVALASDPAKALELSARAVKELPADVLSQLCRAKALLAAGDKDEALGILAWLETVHAGVVAAHVADAAEATKTAEAVPPKGSGIPSTEAPPEVEEEPSAADEPLDEMDQRKLRMVRRGDSGWLRSRNTAITALLLEATVPFDAIRALRFSDLELDTGHARFSDGYLQLEHDTIAKLRHWALTFPANPKLLGRVGARYVLAGEDLEPLSEETVDAILKTAGEEADVLGLTLERIEATFAVQQAIDEDESD